MIQILFVLMALCAIDAHAFFTYDSAASLMEQGKWNEAKQQLQKLLVDKPDASDILYDAGVASYHTKDYKQARAYFKRVTELPQTQVQLKEQAHFNAGNTAAALKEYEDAIGQYETVLNINKSNEKAKRNIAQIKELMKRKQEQQNKKDSKDTKENKDQKEKKSSDAQQQGDNKKGNEENGRQDEKEKKEMSQDSQKQKQQEKGDQEQQSADADQEDRGKDADDKQGQQADKSKQEQEGHEKAPSQNDTKQPTQGTDTQEKDQGEVRDAVHGDQNNLQQKLDARLARVLEVQEKKDAALNKRMINAAVGQSMGGAQGENCW